MTRSQRFQYALLSVLFFVSLIHFSQTWFARQNLPSNFGTRPVIFDVLFFVLLSLVLLHPIFMIVLGWLVSGQVKAGDDLTPLALPASPLRVAMITTYVAKSEPLSILTASLKSMKQAVDPDGWSHDVWVLDERIDQEDGYRVERLCRQLGVKYFTRRGIERYHQVGTKFTPKSKGGNHNAWYDAHGFEEYDIVAQFDTDFIVRKDALLRILPYFADPNIGWVGTPQIYANTHHFIARGAAEQTYGFYGPFQRGRSGMGAAQLIGANHTIRVAALRQIGGYDPHLTEDLATSIELHSIGWKSVYVPKALAHGEGPTTFDAYFKQQFRWAKGCLDLLMTSSLRRVNKMPKTEAVTYVWLQLFYLNGLMFGIGIVLMLLKFSFGWQSVSLDLVSFLEAYLPMYAMIEIMMYWLQRFNVRPDKEKGLFIRGRVLMLAAMPVFLWAFFSALRDRGKHTEFEVTAKGGATIDVRVRKVKRKGGSVFRPHLSVAITCMLGLIIGASLDNLDVVNLLWTTLIGISLFVIALRPKWFELKDEFNVQSRAFIRQIKREGRLLLEDQKKLGRSIRKELLRIQPHMSAALPSPVVATYEYEVLLSAHLDSLSPRQPLQPSDQ